MENSINQNCIKKRHKNIAIEVVKTRNVQELKRNKINITTDVVDTQGQQLSGFGALRKMVIRNQKSHAITVEF